MDIWLNSIYEIDGLAIFLAGFLWLCAKRPKVAIYLTIFFLPAYLLRVKIFFIPLNVLEIMIWLGFLVWLVKRGYKNAPWQEIRQFFWPAVLILAGVGFGVAFSSDSKVSAGILKGWFLAPMAFGLFAWAQLKGKEIKNALWALVASGAAVSTISAFCWIEGKTTFDERLTGIFLSPNHLAMFMAPIFLAGIGLLVFSKEEKERKLLAGSLLLSGIVVYLTLSYAAWLGILAGGFFMAIVVFWEKNRNRRVFFICALLLAVIIGVLFFAQVGSEKLDNFLYSSRSSWQSRLMIWQAAWKIGKDYPVFGIGPGMFQEYYLAYQKYFSVPYLEWAVPQPHNLFLAFWLQAGILGLAGLIWLLASFSRVIAASIKRKNSMAIILAAVMIYVVAHGLVDTAYFKNDLAVVFWLVIALGAIAAGEKQKAADTAADSGNAKKVNLSPALYSKPGRQAG